ncbi:hypothetical protein C900_03135 [Fulvivirga imtechensis AK7]|uniref:Uncharacterized protein n=1 Tax=Fulvivirga imtechensis AK7 TaxID=1237149 RepID=L8JQ79_9BACT|nr:hypothetical protein C900_03135 [Fulvivirga imtechensis AK7]
MLSHLIEKPVINTLKWIHARSITYLAAKQMVNGVPVIIKVV